MKTTRPLPELNIFVDVGIDISGQTMQREIINLFLFLM